ELRPPRRGRRAQPAVGGEDPRGRLARSAEDAPARARTARREDGLVEEPVETARYTDAPDHLPNRQERPSDVRRGRLAGVVPDRQPLALVREDHLGRDDEAREP